MSTAVNTMKDFFNIMKNYSEDANVDGIAVLDDAVRSVTHFANLQDAINNFVEDTTNTEIYPDTDQRLQATSGIVLGADNDFTVDTGAISGKNAGGETVKNAVTIVPETSDLTNLSLPTEGSTTTHTYTGEDGKTFTFYIKWPASFTKFYNLNGVNDYYEWQKMSVSERESYYTDLDSVSGAKIISGMETVIKGMYNFWLSEASKLAYDSYGVDFNGKTVRVQFASGGWITEALADTEWGYENFTEYTLPTNEITLTINAVYFSVIDPDDPNGNTRIERGIDVTYLDRIIAHEMIHGVMFGQGLIKYTSPEFFTEGIADLVHGSDDYDGRRTSYIRTLAESKDSLSGAMSLEPGTGTSNRYIAGYMFLRYLCQQSLKTGTQIGHNGFAINFNYDGGENIISKYKSSDSISYSTDYIGVEVSGNDLVLNSSSGKLYIRDARDQLVNIFGASENIPSYAYMASSAGDLNGESYSGIEIIVGADNASNTITAGSGGSSLWGGNGNTEDILNGGSGQDVFFYGYGNGNDTINNADSNDSINLFGITTDQISIANITDNEVNFQFTNGGSLTINGQPGSFVLSSSGQTYHADYQNKIWTT